LPSKPFPTAETVDAIKPETFARNLHNEASPIPADQEMDDGPWAFEEDYNFDTTDGPWAFEEDYFVHEPSTIASVEAVNSHESYTTDPDEELAPGDEWAFLEDVNLSGPSDHAPPDDFEKARVPDMSEKIPPAYPNRSDTPTSSENIKIPTHTDLIQKLRDENQQMRHKIHDLETKVKELSFTQEKEQLNQARLDELHAQLTRQETRLYDADQAHAVDLQLCQRQTTRVKAMLNSSREEISTLELEVTSLQTTLLSSKKTTDKLQKQMALMSNFHHDEMSRQERHTTEVKLALAKAKQDCASTIDAHLQHQNISQHQAEIQHQHQNVTIQALRMSHSKLQAQHNLSSILIQQLQSQKMELTAQLNTTTILHQMNIGLLNTSRQTIGKLRVDLAKCQLSIEKTNQTCARKLATYSSQQNDTHHQSIKQLHEQTQIIRELGVVQQSLHHQNNISTAMIQTLKTEQAQLVHQLNKTSQLHHENVARLNLANQTISQLHQNLSMLGQLHEHGQLVLNKSQDDIIRLNLDLERCNISKSVLLALLDAEQNQVAILTKSHKSILSEKTSLQATEEKWLECSGTLQQTRIQLADTKIKLSSANSELHSCSNSLNDMETIAGNCSQSLNTLLTNRPDTDSLFAQDSSQSKEPNSTVVLPRYIR